MKKIIYLILACFLGVLVGYTLYGLIEFIYLNYSISQGYPIVCSGLTPTIGGGYEYPFACVNLIYLEYGLMILGTLAGFYMGLKWHHQVYDLRQGGLITRLRRKKKKGRRK